MPVVYDVIYTGPEGKGKGSVSLADDPMVDENLSAVEVKIGRRTLLIPTVRITAANYVKNQLFISPPEV